MGGICRAATGRASLDLWEPADLLDICKLIASLRESDIEESRLCRETFSGPALQRQLLGAVQEKRAWSLRGGAGLLGIAGVTPFPEEPDTAAIWFLGTHHVEKKPVLMTKACAQMLAYQLTVYRRLGNMVPAHMGDRVMWLKHLGFDMDWENDHFLRQGFLSFWKSSDPMPGPRSP